MHRSLVMLSKVLILGEADVRRCLSMRDCLEVNRRALQSIGTAATAKQQESISSSSAALSSKLPGRGVVPTRLALPFDQSDWTLFKPAAYYADGGEEETTTTQMGLKIVSVRSKNPQINKPLVPATILLLDAVTGEVNAMVSATYLTAARTAAGSALATKLCLDNRFRKQQRQKQQKAISTTTTTTSPSVIKHLVVFGAGLQAECHIEAIQTAMQQSFERITIVNRSLARAQALQERCLGQQTPACQRCDVVLLESTRQVQEALMTADVVVATTNTMTPLWDGRVLKPGCHINGIGSYTPDMQEVDHFTVDRSRIFIDTMEATTVGDLKHLLSDRQDDNDHQHPIILLGDALSNPTGEQEEGSQSLDCTFYKAVGTAIQDIMTASAVVERAREMGIGTYIDMQ